MRHLIALVAASAFLLQSDIVPAQVGQFPFVLTREEQVLGVVQAGVASFKGIPYASAPVGSLRWRPPQPAPESSTICTAYEYGPACQQPSMPGLGSYGTSEDCLALNVFRPFEIDDPLPVMIWIHGGSFVAGTAGDPPVRRVETRAGGGHRDHAELSAGSVRPGRPRANASAR
jgi:para-nitrobenzyl esterase